eukprot:SAG22_NODE_1734_length_3692_cov_2.728361_3_plen_418_part_00
MSGVLEWNLDILTDALAEMEHHIDPSRYAQFMVAMEATRAECDRAKAPATQQAGPGGGGGGGGSRAARARRRMQAQQARGTGTDGGSAAAAAGEGGDGEEQEEEEEPLLVPLMKRVLKTVRHRASRGSQSGKEAGEAARNVGAALCNLEAFLLNADPLQQFGGLCKCSPPPPAGGRPGQGRGGSKRRQAWLCPAHADMAVQEGGWSLELGRTAPWTAGGLLHVLAARPVDAPLFPFVPPKVTDIPQADSAPPAGETDRQTDIVVSIQAEAPTQPRTVAPPAPRRHAVLPYQTIPSCLDHALGARRTPANPLAPPAFVGVTTDLAELYAPKTDTMMARHLLRRLPEATAAAADRIPDIEAVVANAPGVEDCCAFIREDEVGKPVVVAYACPLGADREAILCVRAARCASRWGSVHLSG